MNYSTEVGEFLIDDTNVMINDTDLFNESNGLFDNATANATEDDISAEFTPTPDMMFGQPQIISIISNSFLFVVGLATNSKSLYMLLTERYKKKSKNRMTLLLIHLAVADLMVILLHIPLYIVWDSTVSWEAGDIACRVMSFLRILGYYLSGFLIMVISIDRLNAVAFPMAHRFSYRRTKILLLLAWVFTPLCSLPQIFVFRKRSHPRMKSYTQCTTIGTFSSYYEQLLYSLFVSTFSWILPLIVMLVCYIYILIVITKRSKNTSLNTNQSSKTMDKARLNTVKATGVLIIGFVLAWTPYNVMTLWHYVDAESARMVDMRLQKFLWVFSCANNCINPLLYRAFDNQKRDRNPTTETRRALSLSTKPAHQSQLVASTNSERSHSAACKQQNPLPIGDIPDTIL